MEYQLKRPAGLNRIEAHMQVLVFLVVVAAALTAWYIIDRKVNGPWNGGMA